MKNIGMKQKKVWLKWMKIDLIVYLIMVLTESKKKRKKYTGDADG